MNVQGLNKVTLLDYPGHVACTVFTGGCDFRCPFCHNSPLVLDPNFSPMDIEAFFSFLEKRRGILDGVAITGGEPLLHRDIGDFIGRIKELGYRVKLDTNGNHPDALGGLISLGLVDYVAMDIKNSPERYGETVGIDGFDISNVMLSRDIIMSGSIGYEFRTTAVREFHDEESFRGIARFIKGCGKYYIQNFVDSGAVLSDGLHGFEENELRAFADIVKDSVGSVDVRGV